MVWHTWINWAESAQNNGYAACTALADYPYSGNSAVATSYHTLWNRDKGVPWYNTGFHTGVTKPGGGYLIGNKSYGAQANCAIPSTMFDLNEALVKNNVPMPFENNEQIGGFSSSTNVNEVQMMCTLWTRGGPGHPYPRSLMEVLQYSGLGWPKKLWCPTFSITSAGAITNGSGELVLETISTADLWRHASSSYYLFGAQPYAVNNAGLIQVGGVLPVGRDGQNMGIPLSNGAEPVTFDGSPPGWAYEAIGPFTIESEPSLGLCSVAAAATTGVLFIGEY